MSVALIRTFFIIFILLGMATFSLLPGCSQYTDTVQEVKTVDELIEGANQWVDSIKSFQYDMSANATRMLSENRTLFSWVTENGLVDIKNRRGRVEHEVITSGNSTPVAGHSEMRRRSICVNGETMYWGEAVDGAYLDYSQVDELPDPIGNINAIKRILGIMDSSEAELLSDIQEVTGEKCYTVILTMDFDILLNVSIVPSVYEVLALQDQEVDILFPYISDYKYQLWFAKDDLRLIKVYQYLSLMSEEKDNEFDIAYEWNWEFAKYNEKLDIIIPPEEEDSTSVRIKDSLLKQGIREALRKERGSISRSEMASIRELDLSHYGIHDLTGLETCVNLESLIFLLGGDNPDLTPISSLEKLQYLEMSVPVNTDLSQISGLTQLDTLRLRGSEPFDITPILNITNITTLRIEIEPDFDIGILSAFPKLSSLTLYCPDNIDNLMLLSELNLAELILDCRNSDISSLAHLKGLRSFTMKNWYVTEISPLAGYDQLESLYLEIHDDADFSSLAEMNNLKELTLSRHNISDIRMLSGLQNLEILVLDRNKITDITPLSDLTQLSHLELYFNDILDITPLSGLTELKYLMLSGNQITDISVLASLKNLIVLSLGSNDISDISILENCQSLQELNLTGNIITDISVLQGLTDLRDVTLTSNPITDITPLVNNLGIGEGDEISIEEDNVNDSIMDSVKKLESRGVTVNIW
ncbi:leucine-rich repeat domain-containing protein [Chloroflexota bacterium]